MKMLNSKCTEGKKRLCKHQGFKKMEVRMLFAKRSAPPICELWREGLNDHLLFLCEGLEKVLVLELSASGKGYFTGLQRNL